MNTACRRKGTKVQNASIFFHHQNFILMKSELLRQLDKAIQQEQFSEALQLSNQLLTQFPSDPDTHAASGEVFFKMENWNKSVEQFERALALASNRAEFYFKLGLAFEGKDDFQNARHQYQTARRLEPDNRSFAGHFGKLLHERGRETQNLNLLNEGLQLMEQSLNENTDFSVREQLAIAYLEKCTESWQPDPERPELPMVTSRRQIATAQDYLDGVNNLNVASNITITNKLQAIASYLLEMEKRKFGGYPYLLKAPAVMGGIFLLFGKVIWAGLFLSMAVAYYFSQRLPGYLANYNYVKTGSRAPLIVRRLDALSQNLGNITIFSTSYSGLLWNRMLFQIVVAAVRYCMVVFMLPIEIIRGFVANYELLKNT